MWMMRSPSRFGGEARSTTALESEGQRRAHVTHALGPQLRNPTAQAVLGDRHHVVQGDCVRLFLFPSSVPKAISDGTPRIVEVMGATVTRAR